MKTTLFTSMLFVMLAASLYSQSGSINNTLGSGGTFTIKDGSKTFLSLSQSTGYLSLNNCLTLPTTTGATVGVIFKGTDRFIHDYSVAGTVGLNTFVGINSGNFTMSGSGGQASMNAAFGNSSLSSLISGTYNSAFGFQSLHSNAVGDDNSAFGSYALTANSASNNSAFGFGTLVDNISGTNNCAFGNVSLWTNISGGDNCAFGVHSLYYNSAGSNSSAFGSYALNNNTASSNSAFGYSAGSNITIGSNNTCIGYQTYASSATVSNEITLGDGNITTLRCQVISITALSDARDKKNIKDLPLGVDFLMKVKPCEFNWDRRDWYKDGKPDGSKMQTTPTAGFIAQELDEVQTKENAEWLNLVLKNNPDKLEATPGNLLPIIVKAIQELKTENDELKNEVITLRASIAERVKKEVKAALLKAVQQEDAPTKISLNDVKN